MNEILTAAIQKIKITREQRDAISAGQYKGSALVCVDYDLKVGDDYEQRIVAKADPWKLLTVALSHLNDVTVDSIVREARTADPE